MATAQLGPHLNTEQAPDFSTPASLPASAFPQSMFDFVGQYDVIMAMIEVPKDQAAAALPPGLSLEPTSFASRGMHPVLLALGVQVNVRSLAFKSLPVLNYYESAVAIPSIRLSKTLSGYEGPFTWLTRLDVSSLAALVLGRVVGYPKHVSRMRGDDSTYRISPLLGSGPIFEAHAQRYGTAGLAKDFPRFDAIRYLLSLPLVSRTDIGANLYTFLNWHMDKAIIQPCKVSADVRTTAYSPLEQRSYEINGIDQYRVGAAWIHAPWTINAPFARRAIRTKNS